VTRTTLGRVWASRWTREAAVLAYAVPSILSALAAQTWFERGTVIGTGDLAPPVAPDGGYTSHWSHLTAGEGAPGYDIVSMPYAAWLDAWTWLGGGEDVGQRLWLTLLFAGSAAAVVFLAFGFTTSALGAGSAGVFASFSAYRLVTGPDPVPMAAIIVAAVLAGILIRVALRPDRTRGVIGFALASVGLGYVMANPPQVALVVLWVIACLVIVLVARPSAATRTFGFLARAVPLSLLLNAWWIVPTWLTLTAPTFGERFAASGVDEWAWTHERASFLNALGLNTSWAWSYPEYYPYADRLDDLPLGLLKFALPVLALIGALLVRTRLTIGLAAVALFAAWLATGLHGPASWINRALYDHIPGFWLFREPGKFLLLVLLSVAVLSGLAAARLIGGRLSWTAVVGTALAAGVVIYARPLFTGDLIPDKRPLLPSAHVRLPDGWRNAAAVVEEAPDAGKVMILPRSDYYQVPTKWGYYGASFSRWLIRRPVLESVPSGGYFQTEPRVSSLEESIESDLLSGRPVDVRSKLTALGVRFVLLRRDVDTSFPGRRIASPSALAVGLARSPGIERVRSFEVVDLYRVTEPVAGDAFAAAPVSYSGPSDGLAQALGSVQARPALVVDRDDRRAVASAGIRPTRIVRFEQEMVRRLSVRQTGESLRVRLTEPFRVAVEGHTGNGSAGRLERSVAAGAPIVITAGDAVHSLRRIAQSGKDLGLVSLREGQSLDVWRSIGTRSFLPELAGRVGDCNAVDDRSMGEVGIRSVIVDSSEAPTLRLSARAHSACVTFPLVRGPIRDLYTVRFRYRLVQGSPPRACLWRSGLNRCDRAAHLRPDRTWHTFEAVIRPDRRSTALTLFLYADGRGRGASTVTEYQDVRLERYRRAGTVPYEQVELPTSVGGSLPENGSTAAPSLPSRPVDLSNHAGVGDCNRYDERTPDEAGLSARILGRMDEPILRLEARAHSACVAYPIRSFQRAVRSYRIRFEHRGIRGRAPRACLWQDWVDRCIEIGGLDADGEWHTVDRTVRLDSGTRALLLFLYADGAGPEATATEYRKVRVEPTSSVAILGLRSPKRLPRIVVEREAPWKLRVRVAEAGDPFVLATTEAYAPGWKASADGRDARDLRHIEVNGYANGWFVPWEGSYELTLEYGPERYALAARRLSLVTLILVLVWVAARAVLRLLVHRHEHVHGQPSKGFRLPWIDAQRIGRAMQRWSGE
jgi:arabinofuranan 3-O-arabinosyltransferase